MTFGQAQIELDKGKRVARKGWNGKNIWIKKYTDVKLPWRGIGLVDLEPFYVIKNTKGTFNTWVPSISDLQAEDYEEVLE
jgi:hypothetical protein